MLMIETSKFCQIWHLKCHDLNLLMSTFFLFFQNKNYEELNREKERNTKGKPKEQRNTSIQIRDSIQKRNTAALRLRNTVCCLFDWFSASFQKHRKFVSFKKSKEHHHGPEPEKNQSNNCVPYTSGVRGPRLCVFL